MKNENKNPKTQNVPQWILDAKTKLDEEKQKVMDEKGYKEFYKLPEGITTVTLHPEVETRDIESDSGTRKVFRITVEGEDKDLTVNPKSPLYRSLIESMATGQTTVNIYRFGLSKDTKYKIVQDEE